jgi:hypothetical protein
MCEYYLIYLGNNTDAVSEKPVSAVMLLNEVLGENS